MFGTLGTLAFGGYDNVATLRFFFKSGLYRRSRNVFQVAIHRKVLLTLGNNFVVEGGATLHIGDDSGHFPRGTCSSLRIGDGARLFLEGNQRLLSGHQIDVGNGAELRFGGGYINHDAKISCKKSIVVGSGTIIGEDVRMMDSDSHELVGSKPPEAISIGQSVWIGAGVTVLKNTRLGDGCVVAAGAVVTGDFPAGSLLGGFPAKVLRTGVQWRA
ncbi:MAG: acyltransferase [Chthoniobacterales bacterium]|nr:acyltransferase [Chthoniobacterales bacterium]